MAMDTTSMSNEITVSICIANFNGENIITSCVESIVKQTATSIIEIIIHDDNSTDHSVSLIKQKYPNIKLIASDQNVGFCIANNRMAKLAQGKYLLFLNNDAELFPDAIATLLAATESSNVPTIYGLPQYLTGTHELLDCGAFIDVFFNTVPNKVLKQCDVAMVAGACLWIPKAVWDELGGFPAWFESIAEDLYLCCRARLSGYSVIALATSGFYHRVGNSFGGGRTDNNQLVTTFKRRALSERNKLFTTLIIASNSWLCLFLPLQLTCLMLEGITLTLLKRQWRIWVEIYGPLISMIYRYRIQWEGLRQNVQQHKRISFKKWLNVMRWQPYKLTMLMKYGVPSIK